MGIDIAKRMYSHYQKGGLVSENSSHTLHRDTNFLLLCTLYV